MNLLRRWYPPTLITISTIGFLVGVSLFDVMKTLAAILGITIAVMFIIFMVRVFLDDFKNEK